MDMKDYINMMSKYGNGGQTILGKAVKEMTEKEKNMCYADTDSIIKSKTQIDVIKGYSIEEMRYFIYTLETSPATSIEIMKQNKEECIAGIIKFLESGVKSNGKVIK